VYENGGTTFRVTNVERVKWRYLMRNAKEWRSMYKGQLEGMDLMRRMKG
jgi:hypothetical protein